MKKRLLRPLGPLFALVTILPAGELSLALMTYNLRLDLAADGPDRWTERREALADQIAFLAPDVFGVQEALPGQLAYLEERFPGYRVLGQGRDGGATGEHTAVFYRADRFTVLDAATFWLSPTPAAPSTGWDAAFPRICTHARFEDQETGRRFWVFNTHLDHRGAEARLRGAELILTRMAERVPAAEPAFLLGDFNAEPTEAPIERIRRDLADSRESGTGVVMGPAATYNDFLYDTLPTRRIDYIFHTRPGVEVIAHATLNQTHRHRHLSDHFPVFVRVRLK